MNYSTVRMYHPSHRVVDLLEVEDFFRRVFGRYSMPRESLFMAGILKYNPEYPTYPRDYCVFTPIAEVFFDSIDPSKYVIEGEQRYPDITTSHLDGFGWTVEGIDDLYTELRRNGIRGSDQLNVVAEGEKPPSASFSKSPLFWTLPEDTGLRYEFYPATSTGYYDVRNIPGWVIPPVIPEDPLGIVRASHHIVLTNELDRALKLVVTILGGTIIHQGRNDLLGTDSTYVLIGDDVFEYGVPVDQNGFAAQDLASRAPHDSYHSIALRVMDVDRVEKHLRSCGVGILARDDSTVIADPQSAIGIPWWFTTETVPGDPRFAA